MSLIGSLIVNAIPIGLLAIPLIFLRKRGALAKLYRRFFFGILIFFGVYWILPTIFQLGVEPSEMAATSDQGLGIGFIVGRLSSMVASFWQIPLTQFPFIFLVAPLIAFVLIRNRLRHEEGTMAEKIALLAWEFNKSPSQQIKERLESGDWTEEKQLLKLLVVLLPISLYLLTTLLDVAGMQTTNFLDSGSTALGWFLEILFVYLATFLMGIHLTYSSRISFKGRFIGEKVREQTFSSLTTVGAPISILSILLFIAKAVQQNSPYSIFVTIYFFGYFLMAGVIFVSFLAVFEPISIFFLIKVINWWKSAKKTIKEVDWGNFGVSLFIGFIAAIIGVVILYIFGAINGLVNPTLLLPSDFAATGTPNLLAVATIEGVLLVNTVQYIVMIFTMGFILVFAVKYVGKINLAVVPFLLGGIIVSILMGLVFEPGFFAPFQFIEENQTYWITATPVWTGVFGDTTYTMRLMFIETNFTNRILQFFGTPYVATRWMANVTFIGLVIHYFQRKFVTHSISDGEIVRRTIFTDLQKFPFEREIRENSPRYLFQRPEGIRVPDTDKEEAKELLKALEKGHNAQELMAILKVDLPTLAKRLSFLADKKLVVAWQAEASFSFKEAKMKSLHIMYTDGRDVFAHQFEEGHIDPALVSGMFSAITSFIKETTKSAELLRSIDHGDTSVIIEYGKYIFAAIFADRETSDVRTKLKNFIDEFEDRHGSILIKWNGNVDPFREDTELVSKIFS